MVWTGFSTLLFPAAAPRTAWGFYVPVGPAFCIASWSRNFTRSGKYSIRQLIVARSHPHRIAADDRKVCPATNKRCHSAQAKAPRGTRLGRYGQPAGPLGMPPCIRPDPGGALTAETGPFASHELRMRNIRISGRPWQIAGAMRLEESAARRKARSKTQQAARPRTADGCAARNRRTPGTARYIRRRTPGSYSPWPAWLNSHCSKRSNAVVNNLCIARRGRGMPSALSMIGKHAAEQYLCPAALDRGQALSPGPPWARQLPR